AGGIDDLRDHTPGRDLERVVAVRARNVDVVRAVDADAGGDGEWVARAITGGVDDLRDHVGRRDAKRVMAHQTHDVEVPSGTDGEVDGLREGMRAVTGR